MNNKYYLLSTINALIVVLTFDSSLETNTTEFIKLENCSFRRSIGQREAKISRYYFILILFISSVQFHLNCDNYENTVIIFEAYSCSHQGIWYRLTLFDFWPVFEWYPLIYIVLSNQCEQHTGRLRTSSYVEVSQLEVWHIGAAIINIK